VPEDSDRKADLDKEDIELSGYNKVQLDKDGIVDKGTSPKEEEKGHKQNDSPSAEETTEHEEGSHKSFSKMLFLGIGLGFVFIVLILFVLLLHGNNKINQKSNVMPHTVQNDVVDSGDMVLDPFIVFFKSVHGDNSTRVLIAQLSLVVDPATVPNIRSRALGLRRIIFNCLSTNVQVYTKKEIEDILKNDLKPFGVKNLTFVKYELL